MHPSNLDLYNDDFYYGVLNDDGTVTPIMPFTQEHINSSENLFGDSNIEENNLLGRILLIIIAIPFIFKGVNQ